MIEVDTEKGIVTEHRRADGTWPSVDEILAELPEGWTVHPDDWQNGVRDASTITYPLSAG